MANRSRRLQYSDPRCDDRLLLGLPSDMHRDLRVVAGVTGESVSEIIRDAIMRELVVFMAENPGSEKSLRGQLPTIPTPLCGE